jgi:hypothetical protein
MKYTLIILLTALMLASCKTTKSIAKQEIKTVNPTAQVIEKIQQKQPHFQSANINKMTVELDMNDRKINVSANCKIKKDTATFISFQVFGFEVFKAELSPDSMKVFDKMNRRYYVVDYKYLTNKFGVKVDYYSLQSLMTARFFCVNQQNIIADSCKFAPSSDGKYDVEYTSGDLAQITRLSAQNIIQQVILKTKNSNYQLQTDYVNYKDINGISFPQEIRLAASSDKTKVSCNFSILNVEFNTNFKLTPTSTEKYTRGDIDQLIKK